PVILGLAEDDGDLPVEGDAVTQVLSAIFVSLDGLFHERTKRGIAFLGHLVDAHDEFLVGFARFGHLELERIGGHGLKIRASGSKFKVPSSWIPFGRDPKSAVPMRTKVAPSSMATSKSPLIPMLKCGN